MDGFFHGNSDLKMDDLEVAPIETPKWGIDFKDDNTKMKRATKSYELYTPHSIS